jgi:hypothetical protein
MSKERLVELIHEVAKDVTKIPTDNFIEYLADYLLANGVIVLPYNLKLPKELYRHMFDNDKNKVVVKCKVGKNTGYGFTLIHYRDGREWEYKYTSIGKTVFLTREEAEAK